MADIIDSIQLAIENYARHGVPINFGSIADPTSIVYQLVTLGAVYFYTEETAEGAVEEIVKPFLAEHPGFKF